MSIPLVPFGFDIDYPAELQSLCGGLWLGHGPHTIIPSLELTRLTVHCIGWDYCWEEHNLVSVAEFISKGLLINQSQGHQNNT